MATGDYVIPRANAPFSEGGGNPTREWYNFLSFLGTSSSGNSTALLNDITIISEKLGSPDGTPENIPPLSGQSGRVIGQESIVSSGVLPGIVTLTLANDSSSPGNTAYYGTDDGGNKGFIPVASAFLGTANQIDLTVGTNGVTTVSIDPTYPGQTSITMLGTVATGTWQANVIAAPYGGTGHASYAVGDLLYADTTTDLARLAAGTNGYVLTMSAGVPAWEAPSGGGAVTSVGLAAPTQFNVSGSPVTGAGTLTLAWANQTANTALMGPTSGAASAPTFRAIVAADIPNARVTVTANSPSGAVVTGTLAMCSVGRLFRLDSNNPLRIRLYTTVAHQVADQLRPLSVYPPPGSGLLFEGVTSASLTGFDTGPVPEIYNNEATITNQIAYCLQPVNAVNTTATLTYTVIAP